MPRSHGTFHPVPSVKLLGLCFEILDVGPPLFTSLQPERPTNGVKTGRCDRPLSLKLIACFISYEKGIHKERKECPFKAVFLMMIKGYYYSTQFCRPWFGGVRTMVQMKSRGQYLGKHGQPLTKVQATWLARKACLNTALAHICQVDCILSPTGGFIKLLLPDNLWILELDNCAALSVSSLHLHFTPFLSQEEPAVGCRRAGRVRELTG